MCANTNITYTRLMASHIIRYTIHVQPSHSCCHLGRNGKHNNCHTNDSVIFAIFYVFVAAHTRGNNNKIFMTSIKYPFLFRGNWKVYLCVLWCASCVCVCVEGKSTRNKPWNEAFVTNSQSREMAVSALQRHIHAKLCSLLLLLCHIDIIYAGNK